MVKLQIFREKISDGNNMRKCETDSCVSGSWNQGCAAVSLLHSESLHGAMALDKLSIGFSGRLDNRDELLCLLGMSDNPLIDDATLVLQGYRRWETALPEKLLGDFSFVIWDPSKQRLFGARDPLGVCPFYYWRQGNFFLCATDIRHLLAHPAVSTRLNHRKLALSAILLSDAIDGCTDTLYEGISYLPSGSTLCFDSHGLCIRPYWQPDPGRHLDIPDHEVPEALRHLLFSAVSARLPEKSTPTALLSGGLDSSSIIAVAATLLRKQNRTLTALSAVLPRRLRGALVDESAYINEFASFDNIDFVEITDESRGPFDDVDTLVLNSSTPLHTSRHYLYSAFAEAAKARGAVGILDGCFGELGPTSYGNGFYLELLRSGRWASLTKELVQRARVYRNPFWRTVRSELIRPLSPKWLLELSGKSRFDLQQSAANHPFTASYLNKQLGASRYEIIGQVGDCLAESSDHRVNQARNITLSQRRPGAAFIRDVNNPVGFHFPFLDKRVVEFCLAAPGHLKIKNGFPRSLVRHALAGILPPAIQWRTSKEPFSPDFHLRYNRQRPKVEAMLSEISRNDPIREIVDVDRLLKMTRIEMKTNRCNTPNDFIAMHMVPRGVYLIAFLRQFPEFRAA